MHPFLSRLGIISYLIIIKYTGNNPDQTKKEIKNQSKKLIVGTWNTKRGLLKRELEITSLLNTEKIDVSFLTETDVVLEKIEEYKIKGYSTFFHKRETNNEKVRIVALVKVKCFYI